MSGVLQCGVFNVLKLSLLLWQKLSDGFLKFFF